MKEKTKTQRQIRGESVDVVIVAKVVVLKLHYTRVVQVFAEINNFS